MKLIEHIEVASVEESHFSVIWLHGFGADGHDFEAIIPELKIPTDLNIRFIFPHAPFRSPVPDSDEKIRAWYSISSDSKRTDKEIGESSHEVKLLIEAEEQKGIKTENMILAGFSQGGVIALHTGLRHRKRIGGILALSTYLNDFDNTQAEMSDANLAIPVMQAHGRYDQVIPIVRGATSRENLIRLGLDVRWFDYPMAHEVCREEINDITTFFVDVFRK
ncbi:alpha/beta hydrolase-fold protein [Gammaproteobacteria bacterium]|nr:alpha/beta hydrolase-fold protein [Gammaproteobacteria bacterium]